MERPGADSEEKREPAGDIDAAAVDSLKALDPNRPIREADIKLSYHLRLVRLRVGRRSGLSGVGNRWRS